MSFYHSSKNISVMFSENYCTTFHGMPFISSKRSGTLLSYCDRCLHREYVLYILSFSFLSSTTSDVLRPVRWSWSFKLSLTRIRVCPGNTARRMISLPVLFCVLNVNAAVITAGNIMMLIIVSSETLSVLRPPSIMQSEY